MTQDNDVESARSLRELKAVLKKSFSEEESDQIDWTSLPNYGGDEPEETSEVWSWDKGNTLSGSCADDLEISPRCDCGEAFFHCKCSD